MHRLLRAAIVAAAVAISAGPARAQAPDCSGISTLHEEALARLVMIATRHAIRQDLPEATTPPEVFGRLDNEIGALSAMGAGGVTPDDVVALYRDCRFDLSRGITALPDGPQTVVASRCPACVVAVEAANDAFDSLWSLAQQPDSLGTLRTMLEERRMQIDGLLACEQSACRDPWVKKSAQPVTAGDYLREVQATADPQAWATEPIIVSALADYAIPATPVGIYPVEPIP